MAKTLRLELLRPDGDRRWLIGLLVSSQLTEVAAALVAASGRGLQAKIDVAGLLRAAVPRETSGPYHAHVSAESFPAQVLSLLRVRLAEIEAALVGELLSSLGISADRVSAIGVHDPGVWVYGGSRPVGCFGLCEASRLAECTGINVVDAFPARDLAQGGQGGPITAIADWIILRDPRAGRALLDLGRTVRMSCLPAAGQAGAPGRVLAFDVGPGTGLLDLLAQRLTGRQAAFDPGGSLAAQGRRIPEVIERWLGDPYFDRPLPRWHPRGVLPQRFLGDVLEKAVASGWTVQDLLCSATHFVAEAVAVAIARRLPADACPDEILVTGGGQQNGMLLRQIARTTGKPLRRLAEADAAGGALGPAAVAVLALLHLDQVPANAASITGTEVPRTLGRLTPGSPQSWQRLLQTQAEYFPPARPLRSAI